MTLKWFSSYAPVDEEFDKVSLLLHGDGTNGSTTIVDGSSSPKAVTAVGNAQISTAQSKFGGASIAFDGNGDQLTALNVDANNTDLTIECWLRLNSYPTLTGIIACTYSGTSLSTQLNTFLFTVSSTGAIRAGGALGGQETTDTLPLNTWAHVAFVYTHSNQSRKAFLNGVGGVAYTAEAITNNLVSSVFIGGSAGSSNVGSSWLDGYIDDLRITKGVARYTQNFTPPTAPFPDLSPSGRVTIEDDSLDVDARQYIINVEEQDGQPLESGVRTAINDFVVGCKTDGIWNAIKACCILAGARTLTGALVPLVGGAPTNNNFVSGDYDRETGLVGDGSTKYLDSNRSGADDPIDDAHMATYVTSTQLGITIGYYTPGTFSYIYLGAVDSFYSLKTNAQAANVGTVGQPALYGVTKFGVVPGKLDARLNGSDYTATFSDANNNALNYYVFRRNDTIGFPVYSQARLAFYSIGESLDLAALDTRVSNLITAIGAAIP